MPLFQTHEIAEGVTYAIWKIDEPLEELIQLYNPRKDELLKLNEFKVETKKKESLAARLALKSLLPSSKFQLTKDAFGKPHVDLGGTEISISHAKEYAAAAMSKRGPVGIDIEHERVQILRIAHKFLHESEKEWAANDISKLTQIWCAKEALYKLHGRTQLVFAEQLVVEQPNSSQTSQGQIIEDDITSQFQLQWLKSDLNCCVAY